MKSVDLFIYKLSFFYNSLSLSKRIVQYVDIYVRQTNGSVRINREVANCGNGVSKNPRSNSLKGRSS